MSLLNTDYKIFAKTLARRVEKHIPHIIHPDQSGFVSGRYIARIDTICRRRDRIF